MKTSPRTLLLSSAVLLLTAVPAAGRAQSAADIFKTAMDRYTSRMKGIDNYTVVQDMMGVETTTYHTRVEGSSPPQFDTRVLVGGQDLTGMGPQQKQEARDPDMYELYPEFAKRASLHGSESIDGHATWVIDIDDLSGISVWKPASGDQQSFSPKKMTIYLDKDRYVPRRMRIEGEMPMNGKVSEVYMVMNMDDYRDVQGLVYPFRMTMDMQGMENAMSPEERAQAQQSLEQMQQQMKDMPEAQRKMMEKMMGPQMERLQKMLAGGGMQMEVQVKDVKVNTPPPSGS